MPKKLKDLRPKILNVAEELFNDRSYEQIDMRCIAKNTGIAVGTLYNYFPNKQALYYEIFIKSWERSFIKLEAVIQSEGEAEQKFYDYFVLLADEVRAKKALGDKLANEGMIMLNEQSEDNAFYRIKRNLKVQIQGLVIELQPELKDADELTVERMIVVIVGAFFNIVKAFPDYRDENIKFLLSMVKGMIDSVKCQEVVEWK